ncbi:MAG: SDR family NAD(P)-dependent oxidoreductase [Salinisphaeraceae bacterium]|nr:SDR family NAD(P)-dependent oxidoreductase [Salinisphaeraceae bacterium]
MLGNIIKGAVKDRLRSAKPQKLDTRPKAALIFGVGASPGIGAAVAQRIADENLPVYIAGRNKEKLDATAQSIRDAGGQVTSIVVDAGQQDQVLTAFEKIDQDGYAIGLVIHNIGTNRPAKLMDIDPEKFEKSWRADCLSGFFVGQEAVRRMQDNAEDEHGARGTIIFTGASASLRGNAGFANFACNKAGLRSIAQAMAREFGPKSIHVAHVIVDGVVDGDRIRSFMPQWLEAKGENGSINPADVAEAYWNIHQQHRTTWTHELDLRPFKENF